MSMVLIKNNLKLMLRSKWIIIMMTAMPIITIALLSNAFRDMLDVNYKMEPFDVGYHIEGDGNSLIGFDQLITSCKENKITLKEYPNDTGEELMQNKEVSVFVEIQEGSFTIYKTGDWGTQAAIVESIFSRYFYELKKGSTIMKNMMVQGLDEVKIKELEEQIKQQNQKSDVVAKSLSVNPIPSAVDYYGIIEIVYFIWCGMVSLAAVISSERKNRIDKRIKLTPCSNVQKYLGKLIPCVLATCIELGFAMIVSIGLLGIHWGNIPGSLGILLLQTITASAFGILLFYLFNNAAVTIVVAWIFIFVLGFLGGSFQTYMYSTIPDKIAIWSPQYYINRTLVEFSTMGTSQYTGKCILILLGMLFLFVIIGIPVMSKNREEK